MVSFRTVALPRAAMTDIHPDGTDALAWVARVIVTVRALVVVSVACLIAIGPDWARQHVVAALAALAVAVAYALLLLSKPHLEIRRTRYSWLVTTVDACIGLVVIGLTGGPSSPTVSILVLVVVATAARSRALVAFGLTVAIGVVYTLMVLFWHTDEPNELSPVWTAIWWSIYLIFTAAMATALSVAAEREQHSMLLARIEADAEHAAAEEERDLRTRLLQSYQSQQDGLRVLLHEFRTPLVSLQALGQAMSDQDTPMSRSDRAVSVRLANAHIRHLNDMLDALGDVALSWRPAFSSGRVATVDLEDLVVAAADAVGLRPPRLAVRIFGHASHVHADVQALRRVLTNLLENASRHGRDKPIDVTCSIDDGELAISVMDRGPGVPPESLGQLTAKYVSLGDQRGTAGLGLWIVQQIVDATGGRLYFTDRPGGGLVATFHMPLNQATGAA